MSRWPTPSSLRFRVATQPDLGADRGRVGAGDLESHVHVCARGVGPGQGDRAGQRRCRARALQRTERGRDLVGAGHPQVQPVVVGATHPTTQHGGIDAAAGRHLVRGEAPSAGRCCRMRRCRGTPCGWCRPWSACRSRRRRTPQTRSRRRWSRCRRRRPCQPGRGPVELVQRERLGARRNRHRLVVVSGGAVVIGHGQPHQVGSGRRVVCSAVAPVPVLPSPKSQA